MIDRTYSNQTSGRECDEGYINDRRDDPKDKVFQVLAPSLSVFKIWRMHIQYAP